MALDTLKDFGGNAWPPEGPEVKKEDQRKFATKVVEQLGEMPSDLEPHAGQVVGVKTTAEGMVPAGAMNGEPLDFAHCPVRRTSGHRVEIVASTPLTARDHNGSKLRCQNAAQIDLTFKVDADPDEGIQDLFHCEIWAVGAGNVRVLFDGCTNGDADAFTKVPAGRSCYFWLDGTVVRSAGYLIA